MIDLSGTLKLPALEGRLAGQEGMPAEQAGWLLDLYEDPLGGVVIWFLADSGERRMLRQRLPVTFYALGPLDRLRALEAFLNALPGAARCWLDRRFDVSARQEVDALAVEVVQPGALAGVFNQARRAFAGLTYADADIPLALRYAARTGVSLLCRCRVQVDASATIQAIAPLETPWQLDPSTPPLRVMALEPDCDPAHAGPRFLRVEVRNAAAEHSVVMHLSLARPRPLLVNLRALLARHDPDLILTRWGDTWLLPRLLEWSRQLGLPLPLNRDPHAEIAQRAERWYFSYGQIVYRGQQVLLAGRWHIDRTNAMLWSDYELDGVLEMGRVTCLPLQTAARVSPGTGISSIQMLAALRNGVLVPWQKQQAEMLKPAAGLFAADQGGLVYQPVLGVHHCVAAIDFVSMFPSEMVFFNLSPETIGVEGLQSERVPQLNMMVDRGHTGIVPLSLKPLLEKRVALKRRQAQLPRWDPRRKTDKRRSSALKWLLVTCFGYLGYKNARFGRIEAHQAVTAYARDALLQAKEAAEAAGLTLIHAYIDGLWLKRTDEARPENIDGLLEEIERRTGLPIALDGVYRWVVFLPSRVYPGRPVANRYFGVFEDGEIKARGIAARRKDTPAWIAEAQMELLALLAAAGKPEESLPLAVRCVRRRLSSLMAGRAPLEKLLGSQCMSREVEDYRSPSPAARAAKQLQQAGKIVKPGQRVRFLFTLGEPGVFAWDLPRRPSADRVDVQRYRELLLRAAEEVLSPFAGARSIRDWVLSAEQESLLRKTG